MLRSDTSTFTFLMTGLVMLATVPAGAQLQIADGLTSRCAKIEKLRVSGKIPAARDTGTKRDDGRGCTYDADAQ